MASPRMTNGTRIRGAAIVESFVCAKDSQRKSLNTTEPASRPASFSGLPSPMTAGCGGKAVGHA
jgi:hypothetical protein